MPTRSTWNEIPSSVWRTSETVVWGSATALVSTAPTGTRVQSGGPSAAGTTFQRDGVSYHATAGSNHDDWLAPTPFQTTGRSVNGTTSDVSAIRYTFQVVSSGAPL